MAYSDPFKRANTAKVNKAWFGISLTALSIILVSKLYLNANKQSAYEMNDQELVQPGAFVGESPVKRKSPYEGAGNSYMGRRGGDRFT